MKEPNEPVVIACNSIVVFMDCMERLSADGRGKTALALVEAARDALDETAKRIEAKK